jgi:hypothetical protein
MRHVGYMLMLGTSCLTIYMVFQVYLTLIGQIVLND